MGAIGAGSELALKQHKHSVINLLPYLLRLTDGHLGCVIKGDGFIKTVLRTVANFK